MKRSGAALGRLRKAACLIFVLPFILTVSAALEAYDEEHLAKENQRGAGAAQIAAHQTREGKLELSHEEMRERHKVMAAQFGNQPERVVETARERREQLKEEPGEKAVGQALTYSREKNLERDAVAEERALLRDDRISNSKGRGSRPHGLIRSCGRKTRR